MVADFETTTDAADCRVWAWGLVDIDDPELVVDMDNTIESFCDHLSLIENSIVYFHNLAFDGMFVIDFLLRNGYKYLLDGRLMKYEFETVISNMGKFYSITVRWGTGNRTEFRDSLKKLPMTVARIAKAFKLPMKKGEIDYHEYRPVGHVITDVEADYLARDLRIVALALKQQLDQGMNRLTVGADSLAEFKEIFGKKYFEKLFPILSPTMDEEVRRAYRGGWTYSDERWRGKVVHRPGKVYDVNSLYPSVMYNRVLPYGMPTYCDDVPEVTDEHPLFIAAITFTAKLKPGHLPCIQIKGSPLFGSSEYQKVIEEPVSIACTNIDLALWQDHYDLDILSWDGAWQFAGMTGIFNEYIDKWMYVKANSEGGMREIAKLHLNSLYGKFATNPNVTGKFPVLDSETDTVKLILGPEEMRNPVYTPMGVFITAYARDLTIRAAQENYTNFAYADTDSLHIFDDPNVQTTYTECPMKGCDGYHVSSLDVDGSRLGAWKHEMNFDSAIYVRAKCYSERYVDWKTRCTCDTEVPYAHARGCGYSTHIAGVPLEIARQIVFSDFYHDHKLKGKLTAKTVPGGVVLAETEFTLKNPAWEYDPLLDEEAEVA